jgi:hypothetical protein
LDFNLAYGHSEDSVASWQSAGGLYDSSLTLSYKPEKLPGVWATAAAGNFDYNGILMGASTQQGSSTPEVDYQTSTNSEYWSISGGIDLTNLFWNEETSLSNEIARQNSFIKLLLQYNNNLYFDKDLGDTRSGEGLLAVLVQHAF